MDEAPRTGDVSTVYVGTWTNWSRGSILGATLTVDRQNGGLIIAILAFFITLVGTSFWRICCLVFHRMYSTAKPRDGLYNQRQAILRNSASAGSGLTSLLQVGWAWRRNTRLSFCRTLPLIIFAALCVSAFAFACAFSSMVATSLNSEVLISSPNCGYASGAFEAPNSVAEATFEPYLQQNAASFANYAQRCYGSNSSTLPECSQFVKSSLPSSVESNAGCPFGGDICRSRESNLILDTGLLDSHEHFGLNAPPEDRYMYRRRVQCNPLKTEDEFGKAYNGSNGRQYIRYYFGKRIPADKQGDGYTYEYHNDSLANLMETGMTSAQPDYTLSALYSSSVNSSIDEKESNWIPIPQLHIPNADVFLFFLSGNQVIYREPTNDSWYQGNQLVREAADELDLEPGSSGLYTSREAASPLACAVQVQYCIASLPKDVRCSPVGSAADSLSYFTNLLHDEKLDSFQWFKSSTIDRALSLSAAVTRLGAQLLTSRYRLRNGVQGQLPDNQWQLDVQHWHATTMAHLQSTFVEAATGPRDPALLPWLVKPSTPASHRMCQNQKILSPTHTSLPLFYLLLILILGALTILTAHLLPPLLTHLHAPRHRPVLDPHTTTPTAYARAEWTATSALHLQRLAHEGAAARDSSPSSDDEERHAPPPPWTHAASTVPLTTARTLPPLDLSNPRHPRLRTTTALPPTAVPLPPSVSPTPTPPKPDDPSEPKLPEMTFRELSGLEGGMGAVGGDGGGRETTRVSSRARSDDATDVASRVSLMEREEVVLSPLPDYDNWPLPPSGTLTPEKGDGGEGRRGRTRERRGGKGNEEGAKGKGE